MKSGPGWSSTIPRGRSFATFSKSFEKREHLKRGYQIVIGPTLLKTELWKRSGHFDHYRENMYFTEIDEQSYGIKPMNCLAHMLIYKSRIRSYRDLPLRYFELGTVHRHEKSACCTGCCGCGSSPRTMPTSSACPSSSTRKFRIFLIS